MNNVHGIPTLALESPPALLPRRSAPGGSATPGDLPRVRLHLGV